MAIQISKVDRSEERPDALKKNWIVVKVGGSLFTWDALKEHLRSFLQSLHTDNVLLVPGGGATCDAIRAYDRTHSLGQEVSHWLAIHALTVNARFLQAIIEDAQIGEPPATSGVLILDAYSFFSKDENRPDHFPHCWDVTSDSLALRAATLLEARELILLKSISWNGDDWERASQVGVVDKYFPIAIQQAKQPLRIRVVNLRTPEGFATKPWRQD
jgi:5-(aminomethyl)-3-furanmethanol phosphate kinase